MLQHVEISEQLYQQLTKTAEKDGFATLEEFLGELLKQWQARESELERRRNVVSQVDALYTRLRAKYGVMPDSVELVRQDRSR